jgi:hypothetical protein
MSRESPVFFDTAPQADADVITVRERALEFADLAAAARDSALVTSERDFFSRAHCLISAVVADADAMLLRMRNEPNFE